MVLRVKFHLTSYEDIPLALVNTNVTGPAKIGHICTQNFALFSKFNLQYLLKYKSYDNEISMPYSQINKKARKVYRIYEYLKCRSRKVPFSEYV